MRSGAESLARLRGRSYLAVIAWLAGAAGCRSGPPPLVPDAVAFAPLGAEEFAEASRRTIPRERELVNLRWRFADPTLAASGRGAARFAPPDSLRIDVRGPLGFGRGTLVLAGDSVWADPESLVGQVMPARFVVWAMLGVLRAPDASGRVEAAELDGRRFVRIVEADGRATTFELRGDTVVGAVQARGGRLVGRLVLRRDAAGQVRRAEVEDEERDARLVFDIERRTPSAAFPEAVWRRP